MNDEILDEKSVRRMKRAFLFIWAGLLCSLEGLLLAWHGKYSCLTLGCCCASLFWLFRALMAWPSYPDDEKRPTKEKW